MLDCFLPSAEETQIRFKFPDGQEPIIVDAIDVANMIDSIRIGNVPEDSSIEEEIARAFQKKYKRKVSKTAAGSIWDLTHKVMQDVKKKLYPEPEPSDAMATQDSPSETSSSSTT
jgi:hypothetical protein